VTRGNSFVGVGKDVEVIGQDVEGEVADHLGDFGIGDTGGAGGLERGLVDGVAASGDGVGEPEQGCRVRVGGLRVTGALYFVTVELGDVLAEEGVGGQAVGAAVVLGGRQGEAFADWAGSTPPSSAPDRPIQPLSRAGLFAIAFAMFGTKSMFFLSSVSRVAARPWSRRG
jgi:hypothetical protein